jgi:hypothetical protein
MWKMRDVRHTGTARGLGNLCGLGNQDRSDGNRATEDDMATRLKLYTPPLEEPEVLPEPDVRVRLGDLLPVVAIAQRMNFIWLKDFLDDEVAVSHDLYEVMQAFRGSRPTSA